MPEIRWNLESIYPSIESEEYAADKEELVSLSSKVAGLLDTVGGPESGESSSWLPDVVAAFERLMDLSSNLGSYVHAVWSTDTGDETAQAEVDDLELRNLVLKDALVRFRAAVPDGEVGAELASHRFWLEEQRLWGAHQMSRAEEEVAADLQRSGGDAWDRLHGKLSSQISRPWDGGTATLTELRAKAFDPDRTIRRRAWMEECAALKDAEIPFAAALNGVKGTSISLNARRGWGSTLEKSLVQNRLSRTALDAMLGVMTRSLPIFRRYFRAKARMLGLERLSWYDLFAPVGRNTERWTWERCTEFIPTMFDTLTPAKGDFARRAFAEGWIDAEPREGKVGGAYCTDFPLAGGGESRILCNFNGSFDSVSTVAHELGHAWHGEVMKDMGALERDYPMTLAETASIFAETLVFRAALAEAAESSRAAILDTYLVGASQVIVDILSRFRFESALMRRRESGELSPRELRAMMLDAQQAAYGDVLDPDERHPWMWAVKGHYYSPDLAFYNFPYAFGQLFSLGLFARFRGEGSAFAEDYAALLRRTGSDDAVGVARSAGFDIEQPEFWLRGMASVEELVGEFEALQPSS